MKNEIEALIIGMFSIFVIVGSIFFAVGISNTDIIFTAIGALFAGIGIIAIASILYRRRIQEEVKNTGKVIYTEIVEVILEHTRMNDIKAYRVRTRWLDGVNNTLYYFQSNYIKDNPTEKLKNISKIKVMINPKNIGQYYMDLSFLN